MVELLGYEAWWKRAKTGCYGFMKQSQCKLYPQNLAIAMCITLS